MAEPHISPDDRNMDVKVQWQIWVAKDPTGTLEVRDTIDNVPVGRAFETAMRYCRDEGWDRVEVVRWRM